MKKHPSFIVHLWERIFYSLGKISLFILITWAFPKLKNGKFVDCWVVFHSVLSLLAVISIPLASHAALNYSVLAYSLIRIFEMTVYQTNVLLFDEYRTKKNGGSYALIGYRRIVILLLHNYFEIIMWFASCYLVLKNNYKFSIRGTEESSLGAIYTSFVVMTNFGIQNISPMSFVAYTVLICQALIGLFMTLLCLARFIALIPKPETMDDLEK